MSVLPDFGKTLNGKCHFVIMVLLKKQFLQILLLPLMLAGLLSASQAAGPALMSVDEVFDSYASLLDKQLIVTFKVLPGHYMYRAQFEATLNGQAVKSLQLPKSKTKSDPYFGKVEIYDQPFSIAVPAKAGAHQLVLQFQGCSEVAGVCYPPVTRTYKVPADGTPAQPEGQKAAPAASGINKFLRGTGS